MIALLQLAPTARILLIGGLSVGLLLASATPTTAATGITTAITGTVISEGGEGLPGVTVTLNSPTIAEVTTVTDETGRFRFTNLPPGEYTLRVHADGFQVSTRTITTHIAATAADLTIELYTRLATAPEAPYTVVRVHYGTNRMPVQHRTLSTDYTARPGPLSFGSATVSIPKDHRIGDWEQALTAGTARQEHHVMLLTIERRSVGRFTNGIRERVERSAKQEAFVFVHGYNTSFQDALTRTALLAYDLKFDGAPITFAWPSRAALLRYPADEEAAQSSVDYLAEFLAIVARDSGATRIHLIAHSMGNRVLLEALRSLQQQNRAPANVAQLVLTAPDVNVVRFKQLLTPLRTLAQRTTLYASTKDKALRISKWFHDYSRAGEAGAHITILEGVDTVDVSSVDTSLIGHAYFGDNRSVITDLYDLVRNSTPPGNRLCLSPRPRNRPRWWAFNRCRP